MDYVEVEVADLVAKRVSDTFSDDLTNDHLKSIVQTCSIAADRSIIEVRVILKLAVRADKDLTVEYHLNRTEGKAYKLILTIKPSLLFGLMFHKKGVNIEPGAFETSCTLYGSKMGEVLDAARQLLKTMYPY